MFKKKSTDETVETEADEARKSVLKDKDDNYKVSTSLMSVFDSSSWS
jgi:hypothetical protein